MSRTYTNLIIYNLQSIIYNDPQVEQAQLEFIRRHCCA